MFDLEAREGLLQVLHFQNLHYFLDSLFYFYEKRLKNDGGKEEVTVGRMGHVIW